jgi:hypothetical protein
MTVEPTREAHMAAAASIGRCFCANRRKFSRAAKALRWHGGAEA